MELENQVCSLELSKKMRELGFEQESAFYWRNAGQVGWQIENEVWMRNKKEDAYSAYTVAELINLLGKNFGVLERFKDGTFGSYIPNDCGNNGMGNTPQDALANLAILCQQSNQ